MVATARGESYLRKQEEPLLLSVTQGCPRGLIPWKETDRDARHPQGPLATTVFPSKDTELPGDCLTLVRTP